MTSKYPARNLPGSSEAWGRDIEGKINSLLKAQESIGSSSENTLRAQSGQLAVISKQLETIANQQSALEAQQLELAAQSETLANTVDQLTTTTNSLNSAVSRLNNAGIVVEDSVYFAVPQLVAPDTWAAQRPSVTATSLSGRYLVTIIATLAGAGKVCFSCTGYSRDRILSTFDASETVSVNVGSNTTTVMGTWVAERPAGSSNTFYGNIRSDTSSTVVWRSCLVRVQPIL